MDENPPSEENQYYAPITTEKALASTIEVVDMQPTEEMLVEKAREDTPNIRRDLKFLTQAKTNLQTTINELANKKLQLEKETGEMTRKEDYVTKKVAALEVVKQIKMTNLFLVILFVPFLILQGGIKKFTPFVMGIDVLFIAALFLHLIMNQRKMNTLKTRYHL